MSMMKNKGLKFALVCLICLGLAYSIVLVIEYFQKP